MSRLSAAYMLGTLYVNSEATRRLFTEASSNVAASTYIVKVISLQYYNMCGALVCKNT